MLNLIICFPGEKSAGVMYGNVFIIVYSQERTVEKMNHFLNVLPLLSPNITKDNVGSLLLMKISALNSLRYQKFESII